MKKINANTKRGQTMLNNAGRYEGFSLREVYGSFSTAKENAWRYCLNLFQKENGYNFRIYSHNTFGFSVAWEITDAETGEIVGTRIETPSNSYLVAY